MSRLRHQFLAGLALALDEHGYVAVDSRLHQPVDLSHCGTVTNNAIEGVSRLQIGIGKHQKVWGNQAAHGSTSTDLAPAFSRIPLLELLRSVPSRVRVRTCSMRCAPQFLVLSEFSVLARQCLDRRIADLEALREQVSAWTEQRNRTSKVVHWRFTAADARVKLHHLYPVIKD